MKNLRKISIFVVISLLAVSLSGCFGNFALTRKVYNFNQTATSSCFVRTILFYGMNIIPVYPFAGAVDFFILNVLECWTGSNPLAMADGKYEHQTVEYEGEIYELSATKNQFIISKLDDSSYEKLYKINFDEEAEEFIVYNFTEESYFASNTQN